MTLPDALMQVVVSGAGAFAGAAIGAITSYRVASIQFRTTVLSGNRQAWINALRDALAEFKSTMLMAFPLAEASASAERQSELLGRASLLRSKIKLMINPHEPDHEDLARLVDELFTVSVLH